MSGNAATPESLAGTTVSFTARQGTTAGKWTLAVSGEFDVATSPELRRELHQIADRDPTLIVLDLRGVTFIDSSGLAVLVGVLKRLREENRGDAVVLEGLQDPVRKVFDITGLTEVFSVH